MLRSISEIEVFSPKLRIRRQTRRGPVWFVEALFPGYLFARFDPCESMQAVKHAPGVATVVSFGLITPQVPNEVIQELRAEFGAEHALSVSDDVKAGDEITIATGAFRGLTGNVLRASPSSDRVRILLELLGNMVPVEIRRDQVLTQKTTAQLLASEKTALTSERSYSPRRDQSSAASNQIRRPDSFTLNATDGA